MGSAPSEGSTILLTGITGFVASHLANTFLEAGYRVRGTVRSERSFDAVKKAHPKYADKLEFAVVPDMAAPNAFDEAVKGVVGIIHTASPFVLNPTDNEKDLLIPARLGVINALEAAKTQGDSLKRVVLTASFACIGDFSYIRAGYTYTEKDWNPATYEDAKNSDNGPFTYCASKAFAERAAWDWMEANKPAFSFVAIDPPWIFGPSLSGIKSLDHLNESTEAIWKLVNSKEIPGNDFMGFVDVRDISLAHLKAFELEEAGGERFLVGQHFDYQTAADLIREELPFLQDRVPKGTPGAGLTAPCYVLDHSKAERVLGIKLTPLAKTMKDTVEDLLEAEKALKGESA